jgi:hypothetical protein
VKTKLDADDTLEALVVTKTKLPQMQKTPNWKIQFRLKMTLQLKALTSISMMVHEDVVDLEKGADEVGETVDVRMKVKKLNKEKKVKIAVQTGIRETDALPMMIQKSQKDKALEEEITSTIITITTEIIPQQLHQLCHPRQTISKKYQLNFVYKLQQCFFYSFDVRGNQNEVDNDDTIDRDP